MRAYQLTDQSGFGSLQINDLPIPVPGAGEVLIRVRATSLNYRDLMVADGRYGRVAVPLIPLSDGAGEVVELGEGVTRWEAGDRVAGSFFQGWLAGPFRKGIMETALGGALPGMLAEYVVLSSDGLVAVPPHLDFEAAATLPCAAVTAWNALVTQGGVGPDDTVLLLGTGGVSIFALQIAKLRGARVIITSSSDTKLDRARQLGADEIINYRTTLEWEKQVFLLTGKRGVNHVVEVGGAGTLVKSLRSLAPGGIVSLVGGVSGFTSDVPLLDIIGKCALLRGIYVGSREMFEAMNIAFGTHRIQPVIDKVFAFEEAGEAYRFQQSGSHFGKVVITVG